MKAKLLEEYMDIPAGTIVEVLEGNSGKYGCDEFYDIVTPNGLVGVYKWRVELLPPSPVDEKKKQIQEAQKTLELLEKELKELSILKIEVGTRYMDNYGNSYVLACLEGKYCLVCYDGDYVGRSYSGDLLSTPKKAFCDHEDYFTKI